MAKLLTPELIESIWHQVEKQGTGYPNNPYGSVINNTPYAIFSANKEIGVWDDWEYWEKNEITKWEQMFTYLLIVLAAEEEL